MKGKKNTKKSGGKIEERNKRRGRKKGEDGKKEKIKIGGGKEKG